MPMSRQHWASVPSIFAPLILADRFSICSAVCHVCLLIPRVWEVHVVCQGRSVGQEGIRGVLYLLVFRTVHHVHTCITQVAARQQHPCPSSSRRWLCGFLVIYRCLDKRGGGGGGNFRLPPSRAGGLVPMNHCTWPHAHARAVAIN